ncbi:SPFH domain-containing protein [Leptospira sp. GIMC2001]|uniref:SPFH domain-containing protein n=1 Tax=Leptospira sp. GIMC2001 TaxID=1513297 RepID=UPI00234A777B|nr:SPFH domain-containing protein [Leptospira sp. GIMC2001]WCL50280.1 SPFH domain-containing protein [Leptospira sp. GIMC2001]
MFGIRFIKTRPIDYVIQFASGKINKKGAGLSFFYFAPSSTLVIVPADTRDAPFIFQEMTKDYQDISIQGQVTFKVNNPEKLASLLDFTIDGTGRYMGDGIEKLNLRMTNLIQVAVREKFRSLDLTEALTAASELYEPVLQRLKSSSTLVELGIDVLDFNILKISPAPEMARALEATTREGFLQTADEAVFHRRNFAVEQERKIKENELQTQIAVEEKNRTIRETKMNAEISVQEKQKLVEIAKMESVQAIESKKLEIEQLKLNSRIEQEKKKTELISSQTKNMLEYAKAKGASMKEELSAFKEIPIEFMEVLASNQMDSSKLIARAFRDIAKNSEKIGNLNISPDLLNMLMDKENPNV